MPQNPTNKILTFAHIISWCHQAICHYLSPCWPRSKSPNGCTKPECINIGGLLSTILYGFRVNYVEGYPHDDGIKWKHFRRYWPFVRGIHRSPVNSLHKGQWRGALMFSFICAWMKRLSKQSWGWWFETPSRPLWRHCSALMAYEKVKGNLVYRNTLKWKNHHNQHPDCFMAFYQITKTLGMIWIRHPSNAKCQIDVKLMLI